VDNFLDFPVDLSKALFICTANVTDSISAPLLDRMDVIQLSSYTHQEKKQIYYRHLLQKAVADSGIKEEHKFFIDDKVVDLLVKDYCREPGVRGLEKYTKKLIDKIVY
jgi:ATP-dependent Lon protease